MVTIPVAEYYVPSYLTVQQYHQETSHHCIQLQWEMKVDSKQAIQQDRWAPTHCIDYLSKPAQYAEDLRQIVVICPFQFRSIMP
jgi:hypothetical protein